MFIVKYKCRKQKVLAKNITKLLAGSKWGILKNDVVEYSSSNSKIASVSGKGVVKGKKKLRVPDVVENTPEPQLLNKLRGNPYQIAIERITLEIDYGILM